MIPSPYSSPQSHSAGCGLCSVLASAGAAAAEEVASGAAALQEFKRALVDADGRLSNWGGAGAGTDPCGWAGIACSAGGEVIAVTLHGLNLHGALSVAVCALPGLAVLNVSKNALSGPVPAGLAACRTLQGLDLSTNALHGSEQQGQEQRRAPERGAGVHEHLALIEAELRDGAFRGWRFFCGDEVGILDVVLRCGSYWLAMFEEVMDGVRLGDADALPLFHTWLRGFEALDEVRDTIPAVDRLLNYARGVLHMLLGLASAGAGYAAVDASVIGPTANDAAPPTATFLAQPPRPGPRPRRRRPPVPADRGASGPEVGGDELERLEGGKEGEEGSAPGCCATAPGSCGRLWRWWREEREKGVRESCRGSRSELV